MTTLSAKRESMPSSDERKYTEVVNFREFLVATAGMAATLTYNDNLRMNLGFFKCKDIIFQANTILDRSADGDKSILNIFDPCTADRRVGVYGAHQLLSTTFNGPGDLTFSYRRLGEVIQLYCVETAETGRVTIDTQTYTNRNTEFWTRIGVESDSGRHEEKYEMILDLVLAHLNGKVALNGAQRF